MLLWNIIIIFVIGAFIFIIFKSITKEQLLLKKLNESEKNFRELGQKYKALESKNLNLEKQIQKETTKNDETDFVIIEHSRVTEIKKMTTDFEQSLNQPLNSLSILIQDVKEAHTFGEIDGQYIDSFTRESMLQIKQMSWLMNDFRKIFTSNEDQLHS